MRETAVNSTRMALGIQKRRLESASRGCKLLKDKQDGIKRLFVNTSAEAERVRKEVEERFFAARRFFAVSAGIMGEKEMKSALISLGDKWEVKVEYKNEMGILLPNFYAEEKNESEKFSTDVCAELKEGGEIMKSAKNRLLRLAALEQRAAVLEKEYERVSRRVNALKYTIIPRYSDNIRYILAKLEERERENSIRLLKVKDMVIENNLRR